MVCLSYGHVGYIIMSIPPPPPLPRYRRRSYGRPPPYSRSSQFRQLHPDQYRRFVQSTGATRSLPTYNETMRMDNRTFGTSTNAPGRFRRILPSRIPAGYYQSYYGPYRGLTEAVRGRRKYRYNVFGRRTRHYQPSSQRANSSLSHYDRVVYSGKKAPSAPPDSSRSTRDGPRKSNGKSYNGKRNASGSRASKGARFLGPLFAVKNLYQDRERVKRSYNRIKSGKAPRSDDASYLFADVIGIGPDERDESVRVYNQLKRTMGTPGHPLFSYQKRGSRLNPRRPSRSKGSGSWEDRVKKHFELLFKNRFQRTRRRARRNPRVGSSHPTPYGKLGQKYPITTPQSIYDFGEVYRARPIGSATAYSVPNFFAPHGSRRRRTRIGFIGDRSKDYRTGEGPYDIRYIQSEFEPY